MTTEQIIHTLAQRVQDLTAALTNKANSLSMNRPEIFKGGKSIDARQFMAQFINWAAEQPNLRNNETRLIKTALGFCAGIAGDWATPYLDAINRGQAPFNGKWEDFLEAFKIHFKSINPDMEAWEAIKYV